MNVSAIPREPERLRRVDALLRSTTHLPSHKRVRRGWLAVEATP